MDNCAKNDIIAYYDNCETDYRLLWDLKHSLALHAGYWDASTHTLREALQKENEVLAKMAGVQSTDRVLDAGCGIGGSAIFLAKTYGCKVVGITLSQNQVNTAESNSNKLAIFPKPSFQKMDFCHTTFLDASFDLVWGLESICHAADKGLFLKEAFRILKPGGRIIVADGFEQDLCTSSKDIKEMSYWLAGWGVDRLAGSQEFHLQLQQANFMNIIHHDITENVKPSSRLLYQISIPALICSKIGQFLRLRTQVQTNNIWAAYYQYRTLQKNLWRYQIFQASKSQSP